VRVLALMSMMACGGEAQKRSGGTVGTPSEGETGLASSEDTAELDTGTDEVTEEEYSLIQVAAGGLSGTGNIAGSLVNPINGYTYVLETSEGYVRYVTQGYVHPTGQWCLKPACAEAEYYTPGRTEAAKGGIGMCLDEHNGRLFVPRPNGELQVLDVTPEGEDADTYNQTVSLQALPTVLKPAFGGPCAYLADEDALLLTDPSSGDLALLDIASMGVRNVVEDGPEVSAVVLMEDELRAVVALPQLQAVALLQLPELTMDVIELDVPVQDVAVDPKSGVVWVAHGESPGLSRIDLADPDGEAVPVLGAPNCQQVAYDPSTGLVLAAASVEERSELILVDGTEVVDQMTLPLQVEDIARPSDSGDFVVVVRDLDTDLGFVVLDAARPATETDPPPLHAFVMAAIEQPADGDLEMLESGEVGCELVESYASLIEHNTAALGMMNMSVAVAITHNFVRALDFCGQLDVLDLLEGAGFQLGYMIHNRPGYHCTNSPGWEEADTCAPGDENFCDPMVDDCSFPGDEGYCAMGDQACFQAFIDEQSLYTEGRMPSGASFVLGADRYGHWGWDWVEGYRNMARPGGVVGHDTTAFGHLWAYTDQMDLMDPRGKNTGPWRVGHAVEAWAVGYPEIWDVDSAFSDLVYLPGLSTSVLKVHEQHSNGLFLLDLFQSSVPMTYTEEDFRVLNQLLRQSINRRGVVGPNVWYFHLHDLSTVNLMDGEGVEQPALSQMSAWVELVEATQVAPGHMKWAVPSEIRAVWDEVR